MNAKIKYLEFDSSLFGYKVGKAVFLNSNKEELLEFYSDAMAEGYRLVYCYPKDQNSSILLNEANAKVADHKCIYLKEKLIVYDQNPHIKSFSQNGNIEKLLQLTLQSGVYSRFKIDPSFKNNEFEKLYSIWINKSISKEIADDILVYYDNGKESGFVSYKIEEDICDLTLIAVDDSVRNRGIGNSLIKQLESVCYKRGVNKIKVATQLINEVACRFYETKGFNLSHVETVYHLWI